jgi:hypothetical protein
VNGTLVGDRQKRSALLVGKRPVDGDRPLDMIDESAPALATRAVIGVHPRMAQSHCYSAH